MKPLHILLILGLFAGSKSAPSQTAPSAPFSDPEEIRVRHPEVIAQTVRQVLSATERADLCRKGHGFIGFTCQVNSRGQIVDVLSVQLHQAAKSVPAPIIGKLKEQICKKVQFYVPAMYKSDSRSEFRRPGVVIPLQAFCQ